MALTLKEKPALIDGSNAVEGIETPGIDAALLMSILEEMESQCEEYCNEEQVNSLMESLEAEIRMANHGSCSSIEGDVEHNGSFEWAETETVPSSPSDDMNWLVEDHVEEMEMEMDGYLVQFENEIQSGNGFSAYLWQETYDAAIYN